MKRKWKVEKSWAEVTEGFEKAKRPPAGGYVGQIVKISDVEDREYLLCKLDIVEGEFKDCGRTNEEVNHNDYGYHTWYLSYKESAQNLFKHALNSLEKSNRGFSADQFDDDEEKLKGLYIGFVLGEYEVLSKKGDGKIYLNTRVDKVYSVDDIHNNNFTVPAVKKLEQAPETSQNNSASDVSVQDLPF